MTKDNPLPNNDQPKLLLVDDDETFCAVLSQALKRRGYEVLVAQDVVHGITLAEEALPEFAVIDLRIGHEIWPGISRKTP